MTYAICRFIHTKHIEYTCILMYVPGTCECLPILDLFTANQKAKLRFPDIISTY